MNVNATQEDREVFQYLVYGDRPESGTEFHASFGRSRGVMRFADLHVEPENYDRIIMLRLSSSTGETAAGGSNTVLYPELHDYVENFTIEERGQLPAVTIEAEFPLVDFGEIPTVVEAQAMILLGRLPRSVSLLLAAIRDWISTRPGIVTRAWVAVVAEPETPAWEEVVVTLRVDTETTGALDLWDDLADQLGKVKDRIGDHDRSIIDSGFGVHLIWGDEDADGDAAA